MLCYGGDMRALMLNALDLGMLNGDFAFLTVNLLPSAAVGNNTFMGNDGRDAEAALAFRGILSIHVREPTTPLWQTFKQKVREKMNASPFYIQLDESEQVRSTGLLPPFLKCIQSNLHLTTTATLSCPGGCSLLFGLAITATATKTRLNCQNNLSTTTS